MNSSQNVTTPTSSSRPSLDVPRSATTSPNANTPNATTAAAAKKNNRAALREYYNLKKSGPSTPTLEITAAAGGAGGDEHGDYGGAPPSPLATELDSPGLDPAEFARKALATGGLADVLALQARVLGEMRALDAERKALVYDNYSKLISATETIRRMRANMDPLNPVASTLDPTISKIYEQASSIRETARRELDQHDVGGESGDDGKRSSDATQRTARKRTRELAIGVLETPHRLRSLVADGRLEEAKKEWELPRKLLGTWKERGLGGLDVEACIREGDAALAGDGDESPESSGTSGRNSVE